MKYFHHLVICILFSIQIFAQSETAPVFPGCDEYINQEVQNECFKEQVTNKVLGSIVVSDTNYKGTVNTVFYVNKEGEFKILEIYTASETLKTEIKKAFSSLPKVIPAKYDNQNMEVQYILPIRIPLEKNNKQNTVRERFVKTELAKDIAFVKPDTVKLLEHHSELNMPYTHKDYTELDYYYNLSNNSHTSVKPYVFSEIMEYADLDKMKSEMMKSRSTWLGKKLLNEHFVQIQGRDYWLTIDPIVDLQLGKDNSDIPYTYNNTRGLQIQGSIGKKFSYSTTLLESQGRFSEYVNEYAESIKPDGGNPAIIPGRGIAKAFGDGSYDYPVAQAYLSYSPSKFFNFQFGHGKNFIGDGYRSMFISEAASPNPYFKINTKFWKIKYTNIWSWMKDVRPEETVNGVYKQKLMATHYLSLNVTKKLNIGLFESVLWDSQNRGFDVNYVNPIIFYRTIEFATGSRDGNALVGFSAKYKFTDKFSMYSQLMLDELTVGEVGRGNGYWGNKSGFQIGAKYHHAFGVQNLHLQAEFNSARPYTYSHNKVLLNYGNTNQPIAHTWGANFREAVFIVNYSLNRWYVNAKAIGGVKGFDIDGDPASYGGDIYRDYSDRVSDYGNEIGQGNSSNILIGDLQLGYIVNPATNLKMFGGFTYRSFTPDAVTATMTDKQTMWFTVGLRTDIFDWQFDF